MGDKTTKTVKVDQSKAEDWDEYVQENAHIDSVSHLIRLSVERELSGAYDQPQTPSDASDDASSGELLTTLRQIQTGIGDLEERMSALEQVEEAEASYDLKKAIYEILPADTELEDPIGMIDEIPKPENPDDLGVMTPQEVARKLGADVSDVEDTLKELAETTGQVQRSDLNHDGNHYWKKGQ
ncbi:hypothetical protein [Haloarcula sp. CGMCC 1.6347]|uniref:hypothetical protein n=1 Tax=Haloarcula sp. CGMCC 1.6347 TaxID=3111455 RepID=UPI00300E9BB6